MTEAQSVAETGEHSRFLEFSLFPDHPGAISDSYDDDESTDSDSDIEKSRDHFSTKVGKKSINIMDFDPSSDIIPPLDIDPTTPLEFQLREACLHVLKDRMQKGAVAFGFGFLLHRLDPAVRQRLDSEASVNPDFITATPRQFDQWLVKNAAQLGLKAFVPPGGGRAEYRMLALQPTDDEVELVQKLKEHVSLKKCISVGDFYREIIKPEIRYRNVVNSTFGADSARFARCHPEVCTVLSNRFILEPMPSTVYVPKPGSTSDASWTKRFLSAVCAFMKCQRHSIPVSCISQAFAPWKGPVQAIWGSWKEMFDDNQQLFFISAPSAQTGRADLYAVLEGDVNMRRPIKYQEKSNTYGTFPAKERRKAPVIAWSGQRGRPVGDVRRGTRGGVTAARNLRQYARAEQVDNWRSNSRSSSAESSPEGPIPLPRRMSGPNSPSGSDSYDSPVKLNVHSEPILVRNGFTSPTVIHVKSLRDATSAVASMRAMTTIAFKTFGNQQSMAGSYCSALSITARCQDLPKLPVYVFDFTRLPPVNELLKVLFEDTKVMKIAHAGALDCKIIASQFRVPVEPYTDTAVLQRMLPGAQRPTNDNTDIPLNFLLARYGMPPNAPLGEIDQSALSWMTCSSQLISYAAHEVAFLVDLYEFMMREVNRANQNVTLSAPGPTLTPGSFADPASLISSAKCGVSMDYEISFVRRKSVRVTVEAADPKVVHLQEAGDVLPLMGLLPDDIACEVTRETQIQQQSAREINLDLGRPVTLSLSDGSTVVLKSNSGVTSMSPLLHRIGVSLNKLSSGVHEAEIVLTMTELFNSTGRIGVPGTLHSITAIRNMSGEISGLSYHVGTHFEGYGQLLEDIIDEVEGKGQTLANVGILAGRVDDAHRASMMREFASQLSASEKRKVVVLDTNASITGAADRHFDHIGSSRRLQVPTNAVQSSMISQTIVSHRPDVMIVGEIFTGDVGAVAGAVDYGTAVIAGIPMMNFIAAIKSKLLHPLFGKFVSADKSSSSTRASLRGTSTIVKRQIRGTFSHLIEITSPGTVVIYPQLDQLIERMLNKDDAFVEERWIAPNGKMFGRFVQVPALDEMVVQEILAL